jgi:hypothetical protein
VLDHANFLELKKGHTGAYLIFEGRKLPKFNVLPEIFLLIIMGANVISTWENPLRLAKALEGWRSVPAWRPAQT